MAARVHGRHSDRALRPGCGTGCSVLCAGLGGALPDRPAAGMVGGDVRSEPAGGVRVEAEARVSTGAPPVCVFKGRTVCLWCCGDCAVRGMLLGTLAASHGAPHPSTVPDVCRHGRPRRDHFDGYGRAGAIRRPWRGARSCLLPHGCCSHGVSCSAWSVGHLKARHVLNSSCMSAGGCAELRPSGWRRARTIGRVGRGSRLSLTSHVPLLPAPLICACLLHAGF